jgi:hypothetical protein
MAQGVNGFYFISIGAEEEKEFPFSLSTFHTLTDAWMSSRTMWYGSDDDIENDGKEKVETRREKRSRKKGNAGR